MAILLTIEAEDPEVERLLSFLQENCERQTVEKIYLLERAITWLRATEPITYHVSSKRSSIDLSLSGRNPLHPLRFEMPLEPSQA